jgi:hypothetical protein
LKRADANVQPQTLSQGAQICGLIAKRTEAAGQHPSSCRPINISVGALALKPAPTARRYAATGLDRSARPSKSASRAANDYLTTPPKPIQDAFLLRPADANYSGVDIIPTA